MLNTFSPPHHISHCCFNTHPISLLHSSHHHLHLHHHHHHHHHHHRHRPYNSRIHPPHFSTGVFYSLSAIDNKHHHQNQEQDEDPDDDQEQYQEQEQDQDQDTPFFNPVYNSPPIYLNEIKQDSDTERGDFGSGIFTNMWWADLKAALGQRVNVEGLMFSVSVITRNKHWVIPHVSVPDVRYIDWAALKRKGFEGVVFDKDNTLTVPYSLALWGPLAPSVESCKSVFGNNIAVFSNSAGLLEYDPDGRKARALEFVIGIRVIRHKVKKPAGSAEEIERHFGCDSSKLIMVGDRPFTDIVYGNRNGFLTILTAPLSLAEEPFIVKQVRKIELALVKRWLKKGLKPANDRLLQDALDCVKEPPSI